MQVSVLTPDKELFKGEAEAVEVPGREGRFEILKDHAPIISSLREGNIHLKTGEGRKKFSIESGFVEVLDNDIALLVETPGEDNTDKNN